MKKTRFLALLIVFILVAQIFVLHGQAYSQADTSSMEKLKKEQEALNKKIEQTQRAMSKTRTETKNVSKDIAVLDAKLEQAMTQLELVENQMTEVQNQLVVTKKDLDKAQDDLENSKDLASKRIRAMYEAGSTGYLAVLLDSENFGDFISRSQFVGQIVEEDNIIISEVNEYKEKVNTKANKLEQEQKAKEVLKSELDKSKSNVTATINDKEKVLQDLKQDLVELAKQEDSFLADSKAIEKKIIAMQSSGKYSGTMGWPVPGYTNFSKYGMRMHPILKVKKLHTGIDIGCKTGDKIVAANAGTVIMAAVNGGYGKCVIIDHGGKIATLYGHNSKLLVKVGDKVKKGEEIAKAGSTGLSTGPHCHFEVRVNGKPVDPAPYLGR